VAEYGYTVIYDQLAEGGYQVIVPVLPETVAYGRTLEEALRWRVTLSFVRSVGLIKDGEEIPEEPLAKKRPLVEELKVTV
jgi:predicted RNase H-like HicB family nuclease